MSVARGMPSRVEFRVNFQVLIQKIKQYQQIARNRQSSMAESAKQGCTKPPIKYGGICHIPEIKPETKSKTTTTWNMSDINDYITLGMLYGGKAGRAPQSPDAWRVAVQKRLLKQGGLLDVDLSQLAKWRAIQQQRKISKLTTEQEAQSQAAEDRRAVDQLQAALKEFETLPQNERQKIESRALSMGISQDGPLWSSTVAAIVQTWSISQ